MVGIPTNALSFIHTDQKTDDLDPISKAAEYLLNQWVDLEY